MVTKETYKLNLAPRSIQKKKVRSLRRQGIIPCVIYGKGFKTTPAQVNAKDFELVYKQTHGTNIIEASLDNKTLSVLVHEIQRDNLSHNILHVDFLKVDLKRDVTIEIPLVLVGESPAEKEGRGKVGHETTSISIKCSPSAIPSEIEVDISSLVDKHDVIHARDLKLPEGSSLAHGVSEDKVIATMVPAKMVEAASTEEAEEAGEAEETPESAE